MTRIDPSVVSLAELRARGRQAAEAPEQWKAGVEECKALDLSPGTFRCHRRPRNQQPQRARRGAQEGWDRLCAGLDPILDQRGADMADLPSGASGMLCRDYTGKEADRLVTRIDPGVVSLVVGLRAYERQAAEELEQWKAVVEE